jgi:hypothetical protein
MDCGTVSVHSELTAATVLTDGFNSQSRGGDEPTAMGKVDSQCNSMRQRLGCREEELGAG